MLRVNVVEANGQLVATSGSVVIIADESTQLPVALVRRVAGMIEYLTVADGERFQQAIEESTYPSQRPFPKPNRIVRT